jgi:hypothetical protein
MKDPIIENPPGVGEDSGMPMSQCSKRRKDSGGDTYAYGKENLTYQSHNHNNSNSDNGDETKDFLSSDSSKEVSSRSTKT